MQVLIRCCGMFGEVSEPGTVVPDCFLGEKSALLYSMVSVVNVKQCWVCPGGQHSRLCAFVLIGIN